MNNNEQDILFMNNKRQDSFTVDITGEALFK